MEGKILVMGVGGCGSGFLWHLLRACGFETTDIREWMRHSGVREAHENGTAHLMEYPTVIKHLGGFMNNLDMHIEQNNWKIRHIFLAVSSYDFQIDTYIRRRRRRQPGLSEDERREMAEHDYTRLLGLGLIQLIERDHPFTLVRCPRSVKDSRYCYEQLRVVLDDMTYQEFLAKHRNLVDPVKYAKLEGWD